MDPNLLIRNLNAKTLEELAPYEGKCVAWSEDGLKLLASAADWESLLKEIDRLGLKDYVIDTIPPFDESLFGGLMAL